MNRRPDDVPRGHRGTSPNPAPLALLPPNPTAVGTKCCSRLTLRRNTLRTGQVPLGDHRGQRGNRHGSAWCRVRQPRFSGTRNSFEPGRASGHRANGHDNYTAHRARNKLGESHRDRKHAIGFRAGTLARRRRPITFHNHRGSRGTWRHAHERYRSAGSLPCRHVTVRMASHVRHRSQAACFEVPDT